MNISNKRISKKKQEEFNKIITIFNNNNIYFDIILVRNLYSSDFFIYFVNYTEDIINKLIENNKKIILHIDTGLLCVSDLYNYDNILIFVKMLHKYTNFISNIVLYNSSIIFEKLSNLISISLNSDISTKFIFDKTQIFDKINNS